MPVVPKPKTLDEQVAEIWEYLRKLKRTGITGQNGAAGLTGATGPAGSSAPFGSPVESQFGDTGTDGVGTDAAHDDHVHDRHDDAALFYSGINL